MYCNKLLTFFVLQANQPKQFSFKEFVSQVAATSSFVPETPWDAIEVNTLENEPHQAKQESILKEVC